MAKNSEKPAPIVEGSTAHEHVLPTEPSDGARTATTEGAMDMGMTGEPDKGGDPDQKSTHVPPKTVEVVRPDGSPTYADPAKAARHTKAKAGRFRALSRVKVGEKVYEPGDELDAEAEDAESIAQHLERI